jgi:hypothetical protein
MLACERAPSLNRDSINRSIAGALAVILLVIAVERVEAPTGAWASSIPYRIAQCASSHSD